ncbi:tautomerase family protein [Neptuniibacter halophilus]|uniref:tautomerase family protein n=1 Tax=Neptuniibacter halophilus TaxID=651666 RepID=UPI002574837B|nr:4-oxalocrotonate tautomerase family protein [Neptuniibacter halophilus]
MPYINVKITDENVTREQKKQVIARITEVMVEVLNKQPETTFVVIDQVNTDNWGIGYDQVSELIRIRNTA